MNDPHMVRWGLGSLAIRLSGRQIETTNFFFSFFLPDFLTVKGRIDRRPIWAVAAAERR